jgi:hypothetical protein
MSKIFNEDSLRLALAIQWGEYSPHVDVFDDLVRLAKGNIPDFLNQKWIEVDGHENLPKGCWLVLLERESNFNRVHTAYVGINTTFVGGKFAFDLPKVIGYLPIPKY